MVAGVHGTALPPRRRNSQKDVPTVREAPELPPHDPEAASASFPLGVDAGGDGGASPSLLRDRESGDSVSDEGGGDDQPEGDEDVDAVCGDGAWDRGGGRFHRALAGGQVAFCGEAAGCGVGVSGGLLRAWDHGRGGLGGEEV